MTNAGINISNLFAEVFGISSPIFIPYGRKLPDFMPEGWKDFQILKPEESFVKSWMGTPVLDSFAFSSGNYRRFDTKGKLSDIEMTDFVMPYATLVEFSRQMNVTKTKVMGSFGTVKEIYGLDDWNINIRGFCLTDKSREMQKTAEEQAHALVMWSQLVDSIEVSGDLFVQKAIYSLVMEDFQLAPVQGKPDVYSFTISAVSDKSIELKL